MTEQTHDLEEVSEDKEMLQKAVALLRKFTTGYRISDKCQCVTCEAGKFLNEII